MMTSPTLSQEAPRRPDARTLIDTVLDPGSFVSWDEPPHDPAPPARLRPGTGRGPRQNRVRRGGRHR